MSIGVHAGNLMPPRVVSGDTMLEVIKEMGIVPFFENRIPGYSIEELTPREYWFDGEFLGPWDWKIPCVQSGEVAYGKFLWGGKAAFATVPFYRELMNWRRSLPKYQPAGDQLRVLEYLEENGSIGIKEVRHLLGMKKSAADNLIMRLQMQTRVVTGDIARVYRGPDLHYNGWQTSSFCTPEALFGPDENFPGFPGFPAPTPLKSPLTPSESLDFLLTHIQHLAPTAPQDLILKMLS